MGDPLVALGASLLAAGILARIGRRYGLPTIPLFMIAGIVFGPHTPGLNFVSDPHDLELVATIGLVLLLFYLGLEFSVDHLIGGGRKLLAAGAIYLALNIGGGLIFGFMLGWGSREALVIAGIVGISSSAIVTKLLVELNRLANPETRLILGIIVIEDLFLALYLAVLQPVIGDTQGAGEALASIGKAFGFLLLLGFIARRAPRLVGRLIDTDDNELLTVCFVGLTILVAGLAEELGVSDAIGAFMVGLILAESPSAQRIKQLVLPLRDTFAAVFFFAFGLSIQPDDIATVAAPVVIAVIVTTALNLIAGLIAARIYRLGPIAATNVGLTILARGEFSLILATLAVAAGLDNRIGSFAAGYVLVLALGAPLLAANGGAIARLISTRARKETEPRRSTRA